MLRTLRFVVIPTLLLTLSSLAQAGDVGAQAQELGLLVEQTALSTQPAHFVLRSDKLGPVRIRAWRQSERASLSELRKRNNLGRPVTEATVKITEAGKRQGFKLRLPGPGYYLLEASRGKGLATRATLLVSDLALVTKRHPGGLLTWAVNRGTGLPWEGVEVRAGAAMGRTDAQGLWQVKGNLPPHPAPGRPSR